MTNIGTHRPIQRVGLFGRYGDRELGDVIEGLTTFLRERGLDVFLETATAALMPRPPAPSLTLAEIGKRIDLGIVIGGDGTLLNVARNLAPDRVPLIGVNKGRLGFLADISTHDMLKVVADILDGDFRTEERFLLEAEIVRGGQAIHTANAMNDVVLHKTGLARLIEFETYVDGELVNGTRADGIIVATPTGSTAYAMSAGGPIVHPSLPAIILVPICPHTLSNRPLALNNDCQIEIVLVAEQNAYVTFDGQSSFAVQGGDRVRVRRAAMPATLVHPSKRNHFEVLRVKLHWGRKF